MNNSFKERISDMSNYTYIPELPQFSKTAEEKARQILGEMDRKYRHKIVEEMENDSTIIHVRENNYNGRKVIQFQARTNRM